MLCNAEPETIGISILVKHVAIFTDGSQFKTKKNVLYMCSPNYDIKSLQTLLTVMFQLAQSHINGCFDTLRTYATKYFTR